MENPPEQVKKELVGLELELLQVQTRRSPGRLAELIAPDFVEVGASGRVYDRAAILATLPKSSPADIRAAGFVLRPLAPDLMQLLYTSTRRQAGTEPVIARRCSLWQRRNDRWQMIYHQGTLLPAPLSE